MIQRSDAGFALLTVLWVLTALTALVGVGLLAARIGSVTTRNRIVLSRAAWAREACTEIVLSRFAQDSTTRRLDTIDLGRGTWCAATLEDPSAKLDVNSVNRETLATVVLNLTSVQSIADSTLGLGKRGTIYDLRQIPGLDSALASQLASFLTTRGNGAVNLNAAPREVLSALPGMSRDAVEGLLERRSSARPITSLEELAATITPSARSALYREYERLGSIAAVSPSQLIISVQAGVRGTVLIARGTVTAIPLGARLAIIRREIE